MIKKSKGNGVFAKTNENQQICKFNFQVDGDMQI